MDDDEELLEQAEQTVADEVEAILDEVAAAFADGLDAATEIVAARFSVSRIGSFFRDRVPRLVRRLLGVTETAAQHTADSLDQELPDTWTELPDRYDRGEDLPEPVQSYVTVTEHLLNAVGDRLAETARHELAAGVDAGEDIEQLRARLREAFSREAAALGDAREERIARTEAARAWNAAVHGAAQDLTGPDRPLVKQWRTRGDDRVRHAHRAADGQLQLLDDPFTIDGVDMMFPGDPAAPARLTVNCRCVLRVSPEPQASAYDPKKAPRLHAYESTDDGRRTAAADGSHLMGAMIALIPTEEHARALAFDGGETPGELHLTLFFLGDDADDWNTDQRQELINGLTARAAALHGPVHANAFGVNHWNPASDSPCWVWAVGDDREAPDGTPTLHEARNAAVDALEDTHSQPGIPVQHSPWAPHVCGVYSGEEWPLHVMVERVGPLVFDRIRVAFGGEHTDIPIGPQEEPTMDKPNAAAVDAAPAVRTWSTPGDTALAFEDTETGDGRIFAPGALYWEGGAWPLQYADEMGMGHDGAELAGAIETMDRDAPRITGTGVLYLSRRAGADAAQLLDEGAPLGVSVDLDDVDMEFIDRTLDPDDDDGWMVASARAASVSVLPMPDGAYCITASSGPEWTADGGGLSRHRHTVQLITNPGATVPAALLRSAFTGTGMLTAAAGDSDSDDGVVLWRENAGDLLVRFTRARVRGATLVAMPAYAGARIVLDPLEEDATAAAAVQAAAGTYERVVEYVRACPVAVGAREVADALDISMESARGHLARAAKEGTLVRLTPGQYTGPSTIPEGLTAAVSGNMDLPVHEDREAAWDGNKAASRILEWATGEDGTVDPDRLGQGFLWRDEDKDPATQGAYKLPFADVYDGELHVVANGVYAVANVLVGGMGGVDLPAEDRDAVEDRVETLYDRLADAFNDPSIRPPWEDDEDDEEMVASAWRAMQDMPPMPAEWFREPTEEELPPGSGGVHYRDGRVFGWVAQAGVPHVGYPGKNITIDRLAREGIDYSKFLRARFPLDDGTTIRVGAMTMNVGHHRDGAQCETAACQFDNSGTVGAIVTVGMNDRGMWFSGAAAPWLSDWDKAVFRACQPSYHLKARRGGGWDLAAVLDVPQPGHPSALVAAVIERSNVALAASAATDTRPDTASAPSPDRPDAVSATSPDTGTDLPGHDPDTASGRLPDVTELAAAVVAAMLTNGAFLDHLTDALTTRHAQRSAQQDEIDRLAAQFDPEAAQLAATAVTAPHGGH